MTITANIFTYGEDAILLPYCVSALLQAHPQINIHIIDDAEHPISQLDIQHLACLSSRVNYRRSTWSRRGNLNGKSACLGILQEMRRSYGDTTGVSIKIDTDTLMLNARWIDRCIKLNVSVLYSLRPPVVPSGICYLINNAWLPRIEEAITAIDLPETAAEDISILSIATAIAHRDQVVCLLPQGHGNPHGSWTAWDYNLDTDVIPQISEHIDICTVGNYKFYNGKSRKDAADIAAQILTHLQSIKS